MTNSKLIRVQLFLFNYFQSILFIFIYTSKTTKILFLQLINPLFVHIIKYNSKAIKYFYTIFFMSYFIVKCYSDFYSIKNRGKNVGKEESHQGFKINKVSHIGFLQKKIIFNSYEPVSIYRVILKYCIMSSFFFFIGNIIFANTNNLIIIKPFSSNIATCWFLF